MKFTSEEKGVISDLPLEPKSHFFKLLVSPVSLPRLSGRGIEKERKEEGESVKEKVGRRQKDG